MSKRPASYDIDQRTFQEKQRPPQKSQQDDDSHMKGRKIFKLAKPSDSNAQKGNGKSSVHIQGLSGLSNTIQTKQKDLKAKQEKGNIFGINFNNPQSLFGGSQGIGLFSGNGISGFVNQFANANKEKTIVNNTMNVSTGSSNGNQKIYNANIAQTSNNIFGNISQNSLFGASLNTGSIFNNTKLTSGSLFPDTNILRNKSSDSIFSNQKSDSVLGLPGSTSENVNEDEGDSEELNKDQVMEIDPTKSTVKYEYANNCTLIQTIKAAKYKKDNGDLIERVTVTILLDQKTKFFFFVVRLAATHNSIFKGLLIPFKSKIRKINEKANSLEIVAFSLAEGKQTKLPESHRLKVMLDEESEANKFFENVQQITEGKYQSKVDV